MKIITWNMQWNAGCFAQRDQSENWNYIKGIGADIALLQECNQEYLKKHCDTEGDCKFVFKDDKGIVFWRKSHTVPCDKPSWGTAIYVSSKLKDYRIEEVPENEYPNDECKKGKMMIVNIGKLTFASIHVDTTNSKIGLKHLQDIFSRDILSKSNLIIGGDFNADRNHDESYPKLNKEFFEPCFDKNDNLIECNLPEGKQKTKWFRNELCSWQDDHIYISSTLVKGNAPDAVAHNGDNMKSLSDHTIVEIEIDEKLLKD